MRKPTVTETAIIVNIILLAVLSVFVFRELAQIGSLRQQPVGSLPQPKFHFALVYPEQKNAYWEEVKAGMQKAAEQNGVHIEYLGPETTDMVEQADLLNQAIASKVDGIIVQGMNEEAFTPLINKAVEHDIPVLTIDSDAPQSKRSSYIGSDNYQAGVMIGNEIVRVVGQRGEVGVIMGNFFATNQRQRLKGIQDVLAKHPGIHVVTVVDSKANRFIASSLAAKMLEQHPSIRAIIGLSAADGPGIAQAVKRLKKEAATAVIAVDLLPETKAYLRDGSVDVIIAEEPLEMGYQAVEIMLDLKQGRTVPRQVNTGITMITRERLLQLERR